MRLTHYTDYSLRVLMYLAVRPDRFGTVQAVAEAYGVSRNHLMKVVQDLNRQGYIETVRGKGGGMRLRRAPQQINLGALVRDMESELGLVECFRPDNRCVITPVCVLAGALNDALAAFLGVLDGYTLADLVAEPAPLQRLLNVQEVG